MSDKLRETLMKHEFYAEGHECSCGWERTEWSDGRMGYEHWVEHFVVALAGAGSDEMQEENTTDRVIKQFYVSVPREMKCHKCGAPEPWETPRHGELAESVEQIGLAGAASVGAGELAQARLDEAQWWHERFADREVYGCCKRITELQTRALGATSKEAAK
jgi:hypothetical protein